MALAGLGRSVSPEVSTFPPTHFDSGGRLDDVQTMEEIPAESFSLRRSAATQTPRWILTAVLSLTVALTVAFLLQRCFHVSRQSVGAEDSASTLTGGQSNRRLTVSNPVQCFPGQQAAPENGGPRFSTGASGGDLGSVPRTDQLSMAAASSRHESEARESSARSSSPSPHGGSHRRSHIPGFGRAVAGFLRGAHGVADLTSDMTPRDSEPLLLTIRKQGPDQDSYDHGTAEGGREGTGIGAGSVPMSALQGIRGQQAFEQRQAEAAGFRSRSPQVGGGALGRAAGRRAARLLAQVSENGLVFPESEVPGTTQQRLPIVEATGLSESIAKGPKRPQKGKETHSKAAGFPNGHRERGGHAVGRAGGRRMRKILAQGDESNRGSSNNYETFSTSQEPRSSAGEPRFTSTVNVIEGGANNSP
ncbi:hypothetical protein Emag_002383 [Eimeria magna]